MSSYDPRQQYSDEQTYKMVLTTIEVTDSPRNEFPVRRLSHGLFKQVERNKKRKVRASKHCSKCLCVPGDVVKEFCQETTLHGLKYVGQRKYHITTRIMWTVSFLMAFFLAVYFINVTYNKWRRTPVIISTTPQPTDISNIPFPAVTFYTPPRLTQELKKQFLDYRNKYRQINKKLIDYWCKYGNIDTFHPERFAEKAAKSVFIREMFDCTKIPMFKIFYESRVSNVSRYIHKQVFQDNSHCIFNGIKPENLYRKWTDKYKLNQYEDIDTIDWNVEKGYSTNDSIEAMPLRLTDASGEVVMIVPAREADNCTVNSNLEFSVHNPTDVVPRRFTLNSYRLTQNTKIFVEPTLTFASEELRSMEIEGRNCYFQSEKYLRFFKTYSEHNCKVECLMNATLSHCGCLRKSELYLPAFVRCEEHGIKCMHKGPDYRKCKCLPSCYELKYKIYRVEVPCLKYPCTLLIMFSEQTYYGVYRSEFIGLSDFVASVGGLLGLFIGFSVLSVMEILYFIFLGLGRLYRHD